MSRPHRSPVIALLVALCATLALTAAVAQAAGAPTATTGAPSGLTPATATLAGTVNPNGLPTTVAFDYGTSTAYGSSTPPQDVGTGTAGVDVSAALSGLRGGTTYHYRVVAANASGTDAGADRTFTTPVAPARPTVASQAATAVSTSAATIGASVNPGGQATQVVFDYGTSTAYGSSTPAQTAGAGTAAVTIKATVAGLKPGTTYHFRARATNATGTTNGTDRSFRTASLRRPSVTTGSVTALTASGATVTGTVDPNARDTQAFVQIGPTTSYGSQTAPVPVGAGDVPAAVRVPVAGLSPQKTYHYRLVAVSDAGTVNGRDRTFTTPGVPNTLTLSATPNPVVYGRSARLRATLSGPGGGHAALSLFASPFPFTGGYTAFAPRLRTDAAGRAVTVVTPRRTTRYRGTAAPAGQAVISRTVRLTVVPSVTVKVSRRAGGRVRFTGVIRPRGGATVSLRRVLGDGRAVTVRRVRATRIPGAFFARYTITTGRRPGRYLVHVKPDSRALGAGDSAGVTVRR
jgi:hypothetical protein